MLGGWSSSALLRLLFLDLKGKSGRFLGYDVLVQGFLLHDILSQTYRKRTSSCKLSYTLLLKTHDREWVGSVQHIAKSQLALPVVAPTPNHTLTVEYQTRRFPNTYIDNGM